jgi:hypothetical protein
MATNTLTRVSKRYIRNTKSTKKYVKNIVNAWVKNIYIFLNQRLLGSMIGKTLRNIGNAQFKKKRNNVHHKKHHGYHKY